MKRTLGNLLIVTGALIVSISIFTLYKRNNPNRLKFNIEAKENIQVEGSKKSYPMILEIPDLGVSLPVIPATRSSEKWETTSEGVSYLASSALPGEPGNSIFYGHNWGSILGNLKQIKPGDKINIRMSTGETKTFTISFTQTVKPSQTSILDQTSFPTITIYTCDGIFDQYRFVVVAS